MGLGDLNDPPWGKGRNRPADLENKTSANASAAGIMPHGIGSDLKKLLAGNTA